MIQIDVRHRLGRDDAKKQESSAPKATYKESLLEPTARFSNT